ncbi:MAG: acyl-CoA dehydrogenase family protein [Acidimicrobiia bacterium]
MDLSYSEDQRSLLEVFADFFAKESTIERVRAAEPLGFDERLWNQIVQTGAPTMAVPEKLGGGGATMLDLVLVAEEFGKRIAPIPFVEVASTARMLANAGASTLVDAFIEGTVIATFSPRPAANGVARLVPAGAIADVVVVLDGDELVALQRSSERPYATPPKNLGTAPIADIDVRNGWSSRTVLATGPEAHSLVASAATEWRLLMAAALLGIGLEAHSIGNEYVKVRKAFGVQLGWFQTIAHRLADCYTDLEGARMLVDEAAWALDENEPNAEALVAMAFLFLSEKAFKTASESLHFHGGYGYTLEYDIQLYFRRAKAWPLGLGYPRDEYQRLAGLLFEKK